MDAGASSGDGHPKAGKGRTALTILPGGGFTFESKCLLPRLADGVDFVYLVTEFGGVPGKDGIPPGRSHPVPSFASFTHKSVMVSLRAFIRTLVLSFKLLRSGGIDAVIAIGAAHSVPMLIAARLLGVRSIFLESLVRAEELSNTGRIVYHLRLADLFIVQWPQLCHVYRRAVTGTII